MPGQPLFCRAGQDFPSSCGKGKRKRGIAMYKVKVFDKEHEKDLEAAVNDFLARLKDGQLIDVKYSVAAMESEGEQIYCFSAMVIYRT
ncbi:hypothetical protein M493_14660 [Geobacillus genomosp. 3]|uniref:Sporulation protein cse60 n=1 Tax=Geobacillus genomosp. 3 TaxID=1921421 RepID=S5ZFP1_GEOG3|nr:hypothetical protein M493_14660 [Geobacillus genomosp. 3]